MVNVSSHKKCVLLRSLNHQKSMIQPIVINLHPNKYSQEFHYYPFAVKLDRCVRSCNTLNDLSNKVCVPSKTEDLNLRLIKMVTRINELKRLAKNISCKRKCNMMEENVIEFNTEITINVDVSAKIVSCM